VNYLAALASIDDLYRAAVERPQACDDATLAEWMDAAAVANEEGYPREVARELRRCVRSAQRLRDFWLQDDPTRPPDAGDWRARVDMALGPRAWRPPLAIAQIGLEREPSEQLFDEVRERFRVVNSEKWMEGVDYSAWLAAR
jgi:hypothetical protein